MARGPIAGTRVARRVAVLPASGSRRLTGMLFAWDVLAAIAAILIALAVRSQEFDPAEWLWPFLPIAALPILIRPATHLAFGLYRREWQHASLRELRDLAAALVVGSLVFTSLVWTVGVLSPQGPSSFPRSFFLLEPALFLALSAGARLLIRLVLERRALQSGHHGVPLPAVVFGAGDAGAAIGRMARSGGLPDVHIVGYLDDDRSRHGSRLMGTRVFGDLDQLPDVVARTGATQLIIAIPSGEATTVRRAVTAAHDAGLAVKVVPPYRDLVTGRYQVSGIRSVSVEDLLRRAPVHIDAEAIGASLNGASVVVTGGGGSIGSELVRQILTLGPRVLTIIDHHEWTLWSVERDVSARRRESDGSHVVAALADVRSPAALNAVFARAKPDIVFHAAALKHVPYVELFPAEGALTNVVGTRNVLRVCERLGVARFILISTDKAVEPVSIMGATKRLAEQLTIAAARRTGRPYAAVRFGNVLGSSGSVVPLLQRQLDDGLPLTITQPDATRYFMTIAEAVSLILEAASDPSGGEIYVLEMGEPVKIIELARDLVRLNGIDPEQVEFAVTGLRPGERLHEKLFYDDERAEATRHPGILRARQQQVPPSDELVEGLADEIEAAAGLRDDDAIREILGRSHAISGDDRPQDRLLPSLQG